MSVGYCLLDDWQKLRAWNHNYDVLEILNVPTGNPSLKRPGHILSQSFSKSILE